MPTSVVSFDKLEAPLFALMELMTTYISWSRARQPFRGGDRSFDQDEFFTMGAWTLARKAWFRLETGYGAFSIGESGVSSVRDYISNQQEHHRKRSFQEEFLAFLKKNGVTVDERYLWD